MPTACARIPSSRIGCRKAISEPTLSRLRTRWTRRISLDSGCWREAPQEEPAREDRSTARMTAWAAGVQLLPRLLSRGSCAIRWRDGRSGTLLRPGNQGAAAHAVAIPERQVLGLGIYRKFGDYPVSGTASQALWGRETMAGMAGRRPGSGAAVWRPSSATGCRSGAG